MAQERFFFWRGYWDALRKLPSDDARGRFVRAMCEYAFEGIEPDFSDDPLLDFAWAMVADQVRESVEIGRRQSQYGKEGGRGNKKRQPKRSPLREPLEEPLRVPERQPERVPERVPESVRYGNVPSAVAPSASLRDAPADNGDVTNEAVPPLVNV